MSDWMNPALCIVGAIVFLIGAATLVTATSIFVAALGACLWLTGAGALIGAAVVTALRKR